MPTQEARPAARRKTPEIASGNRTGRSTALYLTHDTEDTIRRRTPAGGSVSGTLTRICDRYERLIRFSLPPLSAEEWATLARVARLRGQVVPDQLAYDLEAGPIIERQGARQLIAVWDVLERLVGLGGQPAEDQALLRHWRVLK